MPHGSCPFWPENACDGPREAAPLLRLRDELLSAGLRERVETGLAVVVGGSPVGDDPAALLQTLEGRIERPVIDEQHVVGLLFDGTRNTLPVLYAEHERAQNQEINGSLQACASLLYTFSSRHATGVWAHSGRMSTQACQGLSLTARRARRSAG